MSYRHLVLFRLYDGASDADLAAATAHLEAANGFAGVLEWRLTRSDDARKGRVLVQNALFTDREAFLAWRALPEHALAAERMSQLADWWIGDYEES